jgi:hypothetical protein
VTSTKRRRRGRYRSAATTHLSNSTQTLPIALISIDARSTARRADPLVSAEQAEPPTGPSQDLPHEATASEAIPRRSVDAPLRCCAGGVTGRPEITPRVLLVAGRLWLNSDRSFASAFAGGGPPSAPEWR